MRYDLASVKLKKGIVLFQYAHISLMNKNAVHLFNTALAIQSIGFGLFNGLKEIPYAYQGCIHEKCMHK